MKPRLLVLALAVTLAGCGTPTVPTVPEAPMSPSPSASSPRQPSPFSPKPQPEMTVTGVVVAGVERGCNLLKTDTDSYLLVGSADPVIVVGARLTVRGRPNPTLMTTCQQGTPFQVEEVHAA